MPSRRRWRRWRRRRRRTRRLLEERPGLRTHDWSTRQWPAMSCHEVLGGACYSGNQPVSGLSFSSDEAEEAPKGSLNQDWGCAPCPCVQSSIVFNFAIGKEEGGIWQELQINPNQTAKIGVTATETELSDYQMQIHEGPFSNVGRVSHCCNPPVWSLWGRSGEGSPNYTNEEQITRK